MTEWYYSDSQQQRHGPVTADDLIALHNRNLLSGDTLVWRDGMSGWKAWRDVAAEVLGPSAPEAAPIDDGAYRPYAVAMPAPRPAAAPADAGGSPHAAPRARVGTAPVVGGYVVYAGFWKRVAASVIDFFVLIAAALVLGTMLGVVLGVLFRMSPEQAGSVGNVFGILLNLLYFSIMQSSSTQASVGKMAVGIKVVATDGEPLKFLHAFVRQIAMYLNFVTLGIGLLLAAFTARKQALHDLLCGTLVVDRYAFTEQEDLQNESLGTIAIVALSLFALLIVGAFLFGMFAAMALRSVLH